MDDRLALRDLLASTHLEEPLIERLAQYGAMVLEANRRFNLTGAQTAGEVLDHLLDSLSLAPYVSGTLADVGSGAGFPAIPLAIATGAAVTLIEATSKKAAFLESVLARLALIGRVVPQRAEVAGRDAALREQFACATARAVASAPTVLELTLPFVAPGGVAVLQRGRMDPLERDAVTDAAAMLGCRLAEEIPLSGERRVLLFRKMAATPNRFPRRTGIPQKRPLCLTFSRGTSSVFPEKH